MTKKYRKRDVTFRGETKPLLVWAKELGLHHQTLNSRLYQYGWTPEEALTKPIRENASTLHEVNGVTKALHEWAREYNVSQRALLYRVKHGMTMEQALQSGGKKRVNKILTYNGVTRSITAWEEQIGASLGTINHRIKRLGWSVGDAVMTPPRQMRQTLKESRPPQQPKARTQHLVHEYEFNGKVQTLRKWAEEYGINRNTLESRVFHYRMGLTAALTKPVQSAGLYTLDGQTKTLQQWASHYGLNFTSLHSRLRRGSTFEETVQALLRHKERNGKADHVERPDDEHPPVGSPPQDALRKAPKAPARRLGPRQSVRAYVTEAPEVHLPGANDVPEGVGRREEHVVPGPVQQGHLPELAPQAGSDHPHGQVDPRTQRNPSPPLKENHHA